jgi:mycofactocin precursor
VDEVRSAVDSPPATTDSHAAGHDEQEVAVDDLLEDVSIDGMCGVY